MTAPNKHSAVNRATVILKRHSRRCRDSTIVGICCLSARRFPVFVAATPLTRQPGLCCGGDSDGKTHGARMTQHDRNSPARSGKAGQAMDASAERDAAAKAVRDNMARLKALRLAKEAAAPTPSAAIKPRAKGGSKAAGRTAGKASDKAGKSQDLSAWLASQRSGGYRT